MGYSRIPSQERCSGEENTVGRRDSLPEHSTRDDSDKSDGDWWHQEMNLERNILRGLDRKLDLLLQTKNKTTNLTQGGAPEATPAPSTLTNRAPPKEAHPDSLINFYFLRHPELLIVFILLLMAVSKWSWQLLLISVVVFGFAMARYCLRDERERKLREEQRTWRPSASSPSSSSMV